MAHIWTKLGLSGVAVGVGATTYCLVKENCEHWTTVKADCVKSCPPMGLPKRRPLPSREDQLKSLKNDRFDVVIIGGGATGAGCALDAATRGLRTALIEADDFSSGTSSRSTKLVHGGVRYLQECLMKLSYSHYKILKEALYERTTVLEIAPHLTHAMPIILPVYKWWQVPYYWCGMKLYDLVAGRRRLKSSYYISKKNALHLFPMLKCEDLKGGIVYYDGMMDDIRLNLSIAITATRVGATIANYVEAIGLVKRMQNGKEVICGVQVCDRITNKTWVVAAQCVINATGPFTDTIRKMDDPTVVEICQPSSGIHVILPGYYCSDQMGLLDPNTSDNRVIFFLPWQKHTIAGTTDIPIKRVEGNPTPTEREVDFVMEEIRKYLSPEVNVRRSDVLSAWSGIRPLVRDPNQPNTASLARNHIIHVSDSKLITIAGGKWTTYRSMAEQTINTAIKVCDLRQHCLYINSRTSQIPIEGAEFWTPNMYIKLIQEYGLDPEVACHLASTYGDKACYVAKLASPTGKRWPILGKKIHPDFPYIDAEVRWGVREYALTAVDMIARRLRFAFLNVEACQEALPEILDIMGKELKWTEGEKRHQKQLAMEFLQKEMGQSLNIKSKLLKQQPIDLTAEEMHVFALRFRSIDKHKKGIVSVNDIASALQQDSGGEIPQEQFNEILREFESDGVDLEEYLQVISALKTGINKPISKANSNQNGDEVPDEFLNRNIPVERSGGGV